MTLGQTSRRCFPRFPGNIEAARRVDSRNEGSSDAQPETSRDVTLDRPGKERRSLTSTMGTARRHVSTLLRLVQMYLQPDAELPILRRMRVMHDRRVYTLETPRCYLKISGNVIDGSQRSDILFITADQRVGALSLEFLI